MSAYKSFLWLVLIALLTVSCNQKPKKVAEIIVPKPYSVPFDTLKNDVVSFISGMQHGKSGCLARLDSITKWKQFAIRMDSGFLDLDTSRFAKMEKWADSELIDCHGSTTLFYPFGGPDFLNANIFYPNSDIYILIGLEPVGVLPDLCNMSVEQINRYLEDV
jgi:hypothetical protein